MLVLYNVVPLSIGMARVMAIDYGMKRCGVAVTDPLQMIASGLETQPTKLLIPFLADYFTKESVEKVLIGYPRQSNNLPSENAGRVELFTNQFRKRFPTVPLEWVDERFTSVLAHRAMLEGGLKKQDRRDKELVDKISAVIILQSYLESK